MRRLTRVISSLAVASLVVGAVSSCDGAEPTSEVTPSQTQEEAPEPELDPEPEPSADQVEQEAPDAWNGEGEDPATMEDSDAWNGEGEDPATMEDDEQQTDPSAVVVDYETLPGECINDVPLPDSQHGVVSTENLGDGECLVVIDSRGDSLFMSQDIAGQLDVLGFHQTSISPADDSQEAMNVVSYLTKTHEVYVTVAQDGVSGVIITYALNKKLRGNG